MQSETQKMSNQQGTQDAAKDLAEKKAKQGSTGPDVPDEDIAPLPDKKDRQQNQSKEKD